MSLLAIIPDPLGTAERGQAMALKDLPTAVIMALVLAVVALFAWMMMVYGKLNTAQEQRVSDKDTDRLRSDATLKETTATLTEMSRTIFVLGEKVAEGARELEAMRRAFGDSQAGKKRAPQVVPSKREG